MIYELKQDDPIVTRAMALKTPDLTEVGFIPGDENGCKFYARKDRGQLMIIGMHSSSYGCKKKPISNGVRILPYPPKKSEPMPEPEKMRFDFGTYQED